VSGDNVELIRRLEEQAYGGGNHDLLDEILAPDLQTRAHTPGSDQIPPGIEGIKAANQMSKQAFPDRVTQFEDIFGEGDLVVARSRMTGTNTGGLPWFGIPANDKAVDFEYIQILRVQDGKVVESWADIDLPKMMTQLGAVPAPGGQG
jgi:predicted ester cyclase